MTASSIPPFAPRIWHDAQTIWLAFPEIPGQPAAVAAYSLTEAGLAKALKSIRSLPMAPDPRILGVTKNAGRMGVRSNRKPGAKHFDQFDDSLRAGTRDILRRMKVGA